MHCEDVMWFFGVVTAHEKKRKPIEEKKSLFSPAVVLRRRLRDTTIIDTLSCLATFINF